MLTGAHLSEWRGHESRLREAGNSWILLDTTNHDWQLIELHEPAFKKRIVQVYIEAIPLPGGTAKFCIHHGGGIEVAIVGRDGRLLASTEHLRSFSCDVGPDGRLSMTFVYWNEGDMVALGMANPTSVYRGEGAPQFAIRRAFVSLHGRKYAPSPEDRLVLVDIGAREGLDPAWMPWIHGLQVVMFEPEETEAARIRTLLPPGPHMVIAEALAAKDGETDFYVTAAPGCSSVLKPNERVMARYQTASWLKVIGHTKVTCRRYDDLFASGVVPSPDVIKIDVQGLEFDVLQGFGDLLHKAIAIELEAHFYHFYENQKLIGDIVTLLDGYGFALRNVVTQGYDRHSNEVAEVNAFFTTRRKDVAHKTAFIQDVWATSKPL